MDSSRIRMTIIGGAQGISVRYLTAAKSLQDRAELTALCDVNEAEGGAVASSHGLRFYSNHDQMFAAEQPQLVIVCTPDWLHMKHIVAALAAGAHVLCTKPLATTEAELQQIQQAADSTSRHVLVDMMMRHTGEYQAIRKMIESGRIGQPVLGRIQTVGGFYNYPVHSRYRTDARYDQFLHNGIHFVDLMCYLMGSLPVSTAAVSQRFFNAGNQMAGPNYFCGKLLLRDNQVAIVELNQLAHWMSAPQTALYIVGTEGSLSYDNTNAAIRITGPTCSQGIYPTTAHTDPQRDPFVQSMSHALDVVSGTQSPVVSLDQAINIMRSVIQISRESAIESVPRMDPDESISMVLKA